MCKYFICTAAAEPWVQNGVVRNLVPTSRTCANGASVSPYLTDGSTDNPCTVANSGCKAPSTVTPTTTTAATTTAETTTPEVTPTPTPTPTPMPGEVSAILVFQLPSAHFGRLYCCDLELRTKLFSEFMSCGRQWYRKSLPSEQNWVNSVLTSFGLQKWVKCRTGEPDFFCSLSIALEIYLSETQKGKMTYLVQFRATLPFPC